MVILGVDPGIERVGWGVVRREGSALQALSYGLIQTPRVAVPDRLLQIHREMEILIAEWAPDAIATERQMFAANKTTAFDVAKGLGVVLLAGAARGLEWSEYTPAEVKQSVVGNGAADKKQVQFMVTKLLSLQQIPKPDDVADALAIAICHAFRTRIARAPLK